MRRLGSGPPHLTDTFYSDGVSNVEQYIVKISFCSSDCSADDADVSAVMLGSPDEWKANVHSPFSRVFNI